MDTQLYEKIKKAAMDSINNPGQNQQPLPMEESNGGPLIYVFRHGESYDNKDKIFSGWRDSKLTEIGIKQAEMLAENIKGKKIDLCISSPQSRAIDTAKIALKYHPHILIETDKRIMERDYGDLSGTSKVELMEKDMELAVKYRRAYDFPPPNGESFQMVEARVFPFCKGLINRAKSENINIAISCHGNSMRAIRRYFENLSLESTLTLENPLATTFAQYSLSNRHA